MDQEGREENEEVMIPMAEDLRVQGKAWLNGRLERLISGLHPADTSISKTCVLELTIQCDFLWLDHDF